MATQSGSEPSARKKQIEARKARFAATMRTGRAERVRVNPANDEIRRVIVHPSGNIKFPESGSVEWPLDQFTKRRLREGAVTREGGEQKQPKPVTPTPPKT